MKRTTLLILIGILSFPGYSQNSIKFETTRDLKSKIVIYDIPAMGMGRIFLTDSIFIAQDIRANEDYMKIYRYKDNSLFSQFGRTGRGPNEMVTPNLNEISENNEQFILYDANYKKMHFCNIKSLNDEPVEVIKFDQTELKRIMKALLLNKKQVIAAGMLQDNLFGLIDLETNEVTKHGELPFKPKDAGNNFFWELNSGSFYLTPDKNHLVFTAMYFGYIVCYQINDGNFSKKWEHWITDVKYSMNNGRIIFRNDNLIGFMHAAVTNEKVYAVYHGKGMFAMSNKRPEDLPETIMVFSMGGKPLAKYHTDQPITRIAVNPDEEVYGISNRLTYNLVKFEIKN